MDAHLGANLVVAADGLDEAGGVDFLHEFDDLEDAVGGEGRGLDDHGVTGQESGGDLADAENQGVVPGDDAGADTEGNVFGVDDLLFVFELIAGNFEGA